MCLPWVISTVGLRTLSLKLMLKELKFEWNIFGKINSNVNCMPNDRTVQRCSRAAFFPIRRNRIGITGVSSAGPATTLANNEILASTASSSVCDPNRRPTVPSWTKRPTPSKFGVARDSTAANRNNFSSKSSTRKRPFSFTTNPDAIHICGSATWNLASNFSFKSRRSINAEGPPSFRWRRTPSKSPTNRQVNWYWTRKWTVGLF